IDASTGLLLVDEDLRLLFRALGANRLKYFLKLQLPNSVPYLFNGMKVAISLAVIGAVVAEFISAKNGLGFLILEAQTVTDTTLAFASIVYLSVLGIVLFLAVMLSENLVRQWKPGVKG
ncbi:MAG: ABC transporter permease subunit, partial [Nitrososphaerota archaeon]|nr:ABC transporter permease subunit [Nitrososphaerota archaeon]